MLLFFSSLGGDLRDYLILFPPAADMETGIQWLA